MNKKKTAINPTREENYPEWYQQVIKAADMAENSPVRGCMVIKPWGYTLWENIQSALDKMFKDTGHENAYFPIFIPKSYLEKEAEHVDGFAKECAVVTHSKLEQDSTGKLVPASPLEEPLIVRPTSETIIGEMYSKWVQSYRDLPILINQWANVVRWEMRTRLFLRTAEFLWQEGHTAHATEEEALEETNKMLRVYETFAKDYMALPVICGEKTASERFPGAKSTLCIEAMMQDKKALQAGTSHFLGQNFSKSANIKFLDSDGQTKLAWTTSWGVSTRLIGAMIMAHGDDDGMVMPPALAPLQVVILPIMHKEETKEEVLAYCKKLEEKIKALDFKRRPISVRVDTRDIKGGDKVWQWVKKGVPLRIEVGPRDIQNDSVFVAKRTQSEKSSMKTEDFINTLPQILEDMQNDLYQKALNFMKQNTVKIDTKEDFYKFFAKQENDSSITGGFAFCHWDGSTQVEDMLREDLKVTIRCIPFDLEKEEGICPFTGNKSAQRVIFAKSY